MIKIALYFLFSIDIHSVIKALRLWKTKRDDAGNQSQQIERNRYYFLACYLQISLVGGVKEQRVKYISRTNLPGRKNKLNIFCQLEPEFS